MDDDTPTYDLDLPGRVKSALIKNGFMTLGQLRAMPTSGPERFDWLDLPGIGFESARDIECFLADLNIAPPEPPAPEPPEAPLDDDTYWEADRPMTKDERCREIKKFCSWFVEVADGLMFACDNAYRRHEVDIDKDFDALYQRFLDDEEAAYERAQER